MSPLLIWLCFAALAVACLAAVAGHALRDFSRGKLREWLETRHQLPRYEEILEQHRPAALGAESLRLFATAVAVVSASPFLLAAASDQSTWLASALVVVSKLVGAIVVLWLTIVWFPIAAARVWGETFIARTWPIWRVGGKLLAPSNAGTERVESVMQRMTGKPHHLTELELEEEIREVVTEGQREGLIEDEAREMIESVMALGDVKISEIMTPRTDMISLPVDLEWEEALRQIIASGHTRFPIYSSSRDEVVGILHIKDMLHEMAQAATGRRRPIAELLRQPFFVPETKPVDSLLQEFQHSRNHIAVVLDEFGGVSGLVTIEDVLEEIVGEISDEHDDAVGDRIKSIDDHTCEALARVHISEINERLGLHLPDEQFDTIGGFVFHQLGRIPHVGEELTHENLRIKVLETTRRRIIRVRIEVLPPAENEMSEEAAMEKSSSDD
jgi:CBS domain containing-hemolysin-like protein